MGFLANEDRGRLVTIAYFSNSAEAGMACELLRNQGVNVVLSGANFGGLEPLPLPGGYSEIRLLVPEAEAERARELYEAFFKIDERTEHLRLVEDD